MSIHLLEPIALFLLLLAVTKPLGTYMFCVFSGERTALTKVLGPLERLIYKLCRVHAREEMHWSRYSLSLLLFSVVGTLVLYAVVRLQYVLPGNPMGVRALAPDLSFNTAVSFVTGTSWQAYAGESTMSYVTDMAGIAVQDFLSAAAGLAVAIAIVRGMALSKVESLGNFWVDLVRSTLYILVPLSIVGSVIFIAGGVIQNFSPSITASTVEGARQILPMGPVASEEIIKLLSASDGGAFFNASSAHPFENPSAFVNFLQIIALLLIPAALTYTFGCMVKDRRQGWVLFGVMSVLLFAGGLGMYAAEAHGNPSIAHRSIGANATQPNMEGKEVRFGIVSSTLYETTSTATSDGSTNASIDSMTPLGGMVALVNMMLGEIIFGGVGSGLYGMLLFVVLTVFLAGLMIGRTPEYLGKKIQAREVKLALLAMLPTTFCALGCSAWASVSPAALKGLGNSGTHGLTELLYAFTSTASNNGSAMASLNANTHFWNITTGLAMLAGRFTTMIAMLAMAGGLAQKTAAEPTPFVFPTNTFLFGALLVAVIFIVGGLTYFPSLALGPILEHLQMVAGKVF